jgi:hypothetical protein
VKAAVAVALLALLALSGCETNAEKSAKLEKIAHSHVLARQVGLTVGRQNPAVKVVEAVAVHDANGTAAVVTLRNVSSMPLRDAPIAITVTGAGGAVLSQNNTPGLDSTLTSVPLLEPGAQTVWVDDQVEVSSAPAGVTARVGQAPAASGQLPQLSVEGVHAFEEPGSGEGAEGMVVNHSTVTQQELVVYAVGRRDGRVVAAGRAVLPEVQAGQSTSFQLFFIGNPKGAKLEVSVPPSTLG